MRILWKMRRYPVQDHADSIPVQIIDHIGKILRCPVTGSRRIISCHLIPPGSVKRVLRNPHQLHMGIPHLLHIICNRMSKFTIGIKSLILCARMTHPGAHMYLIDRQRILLLIPLFPLLQPLLVRPLQIRNIGHSGSRTRTPLRIICKRIRLIKKLAFLRLNTELIELSFFRFRYKLHINTERLLTLHSVSFQIPVIKFPDYRHILRIRRPYREINALRFVVHYFMCA